MVQEEVGKRLLERLAGIRVVPTVICDIGCGTGLLTRRLAGAYRSARVFGVERAPALLRRARTRSRLWRRPLYACGDPESLPLASASCDLLVSNLALQWCNQLSAAMDEFHRVLRPGGLLLFSTLGPDTLVELRGSWQEIDQRDHVHQFVDMHIVGDAMLCAGLRDPVVDVERLTLTYPDLQGLIRDLRALGATNALRDRSRGLSASHTLRDLERAYERFRVDGVLPVSCELVYGHAWASAGRSRRGTGTVGNEVVVPLSRLGGRNRA